MNKRQKKKKYKKEHGYNPPKYSYYKEKLSNVLNAVRNAAYYISVAFDDVRRAVEKGMDNIKTMPEAEFEERLKKLGVEQQAIARAIRNRG